MSSEFSESLAPWVAEHCAQRAAERVAKAQRKKAVRVAKQRARTAGVALRNARKAARIQSQA
jgi:hypothetical protein